MNRLQNVMTRPDRVPFAAIAVLFAGGLVLAGPIDPPAGPVGSTYKTLTEIEPRTMVNAANTPGDADSVFRITQPGSYYLTDNVTGVVGKHGIEIAARATLDLNGFQVVGVPGSLDGVRILAVPAHVLNGGIRQWSGNGVSATTGGSEGCTFVGVRSHNNIATGFNVSPPSCLFSNCSAIDNSGVGFSSGTGARFDRCVSNDNAAGGIFAAQGSTLRSCTVFANLSFGIAVGPACSVTDCSTNYNESDGVNASTGCTISDCSAMFNNGNGITGSTGVNIQGCTAYGNQLGIDVSSSCIVEGCSVVANVLDGIQCTSSCVVRNNISSINANGIELGAGIHALGSNNRIESNNCTSNDFGIDIDAAGNVIIRNTCANNGSNFLIVANNIYGTIADRSAVVSPLIAGDAGTGTMGSTDPNANFAY